MTNRYNEIRFTATVSGKILTTWDPEDLEDEDILENIENIEDFDCEVEEIEEED